MITSLLDDVLDRTVVAGFTNVGYRIRSRGWSASELQRMQGKVVLVTGASSGLGLAAAEGFARLGATVWLVVRSRERGEQARVRIVERSGNGDVHVGVCDLSELESVRQFAERFRDQASRLDVLVNNAGVMTEARRVSAERIELTLATNVVGPFLLTNLLLGKLAAAGPARVITVSSDAHTAAHLDLDDLQLEHGWQSWRAYANSKLANILFTRELARKNCPSSAAPRREGLAAEAADPDQGTAAK